jgi:DNA-binding MarR family transcriptional regulator
MNGWMEKGYRKEEFFKRETSRIFGIGHELGIYRNKVLEPHGITGQQAIILYFLLWNSEKALTQRDFEYKFNLCSSTINSVLNYLENGGFLKRTVSESDGRAKNITPTSKGREMLPVITALLEKESDMVMKGFTAEEQEQFQNYLHRVLENIKETTDLGRKESHD